MIHYTLNTCDHFDCHSKSFNPKVIAAITPLATNGSHLIPQIPRFSTKVTLGKQSALFDVWQGKTPITINAIAWSESGVSEVWPLLESTYLIMRDNSDSQNRGYPLNYLRLAAKLGAVTISRSPVPPAPEDMPCLTTCVIVPGPPWLADFEQCMAIAIMERFKVDHGLLAG